ncbi:hypothetical protein DdX_13986 [Ditylenchus destructor]|uniref:Uncharacterized protein n=1 Tax=Ditylenchus destructor TaxID=166010 RepID=A0AAD4QZ22_9BILA|nr:hypothetical protein DdX_13986 [Ditylenchus destructor]
MLLNTILKFSRCMISYLACNTAGMISHACTTLVVLYVHKQSHPMLARVFFWFRAVDYVVVQTLPLSVFYLALERNLMIHFPTKFSPMMKSVLLAANLLCSPGTMIVSFFTAFFVDHFNGKLKWALWALKMFVGILNTGLCIFLIWKIRRSGAAINDAVVKTTIALEVCFEFLPNIVSFVLGKIDVSKEINSYIRYTSLPVLTQCINVAICGVVYNRSLIVKENNKKHMPMSNTVSNNSIETIEI